MKGAPPPAAGWSPAAPRPPRADGVPVSTTTAASVVAPAAGQLGDLSVPTMMNAQAAEAVGTSQRAKSLVARDHRQAVPAGELHGIIV